jgi:uncharacterized delta-60 repeat protein
MRYPITAALFTLTLAGGCDDVQVMDMPDLSTTGNPDMTQMQQGDMAQPPAPALTVGTPIITPISATGHDRFFGMTFDSAGNIYAVGQVTDDTMMTTNYKTVVARYTAAGVLDTTFGGGTGFAIKDVSPTPTDATDTGERARGIVVQPSGKVVVLLTVQSLAGGAAAADRDVALVRFDSMGNLDNAFGDAATPGILSLNLSAGASDQAYGLSMYPDGSLLVNAVALRSGGTDTDFVLVKLSADGVPDNNFGTTGVYSLDINNRSANPRSSVILGDNSIIAGGYYTDGPAGSPVKPAVFKVTSTGMKDTGFGAGGSGYFSQPVLMAVTEVYGVAMQGTSIVTAGYGRDTADNNTQDWISMRITPSGQLDTTWGDQGAKRIDIGGFADNCRTLVVLPDNRVLLVGGGRSSMTEIDAAMVLLTEQGQPDTRFGNGGKAIVNLGGASDMLWGAAMNPAKNKLVTAGVKGGVTAGNDDAALLILSYGP